MGQPGDVCEQVVRERLSGGRGTCPKRAMNIVGDVPDLDRTGHARMVHQLCMTGTQYAWMMR